ncbi:MAG: pilus assembly protein PilP [Sedimenticolaceae bacterium]|nr:pilus assembly protein PilP [Sedimenticolaceae bacterium]
MNRSGLFITLLASTFLSGCFGSGNSDLRQFIETTKASDGLPVEPAPEVPVVEGYTYMAGREGFRSPFVFAEEELEEEFTDTGIRPDTTRPKEELEAFSLDTLRMVGTLSQSDVTFALIQAKDGTVHRVRQGNYMGKNYGRITGVFLDRIELVEIVPDRMGNFVERQAAIALEE